MSAVPATWQDDALLPEPVEKIQRRGVPVDTSVGVERTTVAPGQTAGVGGTAVYSGQLDEREEDAALRGRKRYVTFSNILANTSIVAAAVRYTLNLVGKATWRFEPADDSAQAKEIAEKVEDIFLKRLRTPWHRIVRRLSMHRFYGFSLAEWTARRFEDGVIGFFDIEARPQGTIEGWDLDETGDVLGVVQCSPQTNAEIYLPRGKLIYMVDDALNDSPIGLGLLRHCVRPAVELERLEFLEGVGFETDLRGIPVGYAPLSEIHAEAGGGAAGDAAVAKATKNLTKFLKQHIRTAQLSTLLDSEPFRTEDEKETPSSSRKWAIELLSNSTTSLDAILRSIDRKNHEIARVLGVEHLLLGSDEGSLALARDKSHNFALIIDATLTELAETIETDLIGVVMRLNGWPEDLAPEAQFESAQFQDIEQVAGVVEKLARSGAPILPDDPIIDAIREILGMPPRPEPDDAEDSSLRLAGESEGAEPQEVPDGDEGEEPDATAEDAEDDGE